MRDATGPQDRPFRPRRAQADDAFAVLGMPADRALAPGGRQAMVYLVLQRVRRAEHQDAARADRHLLAGLRIAADPLSLLPDREAAERRNLDHLAARRARPEISAITNFDQFGQFVARQADLLIDRLGQSERE